jgi:hypothetical protein
MTEPVVPPVVPPVVVPPTPPPAPLTLEQTQAQLAETQARLTAANHEAAERRVKLTAYEKAEADRTTAALSETEKLTKRATDAEAAKTAALARADEKLLRAAVMTVASAQGVDDTELKTLWLLLKDDQGLRAKIKPKADDEDEFDGLEAVVKGLLKDHPKWLKTEGTQQLDINAGVRGAGGQKLSTEDLARRKRSTDPSYSSL